MFGSKQRAFGTYAIAKICQVAPVTVGRWLDEAKIPFFTTGGGNRRVWDSDLAAFLKAHNYPLPKSLESLFKPIIFLVDGDLIILKILRSIIMKTHPQSVIYEATNGFEAGEQMVNIKPSLIILDMNTPGMNALEVCARIRKSPTMKKMNILIMSEQQTGDLSDLAFTAGADAFLIKPFDEKTFLKIFHLLLKKQSRQEPSHER